jgi:hypothetical protein
VPKEHLNCTHIDPILQGFVSKLQAAFYDITEVICGMKMV